MGREQRLREDVVEGEDAQRGDHDRLVDGAAHALGAGAAGGTTVPIDAERTAALLGFATPDPDPGIAVVAAGTAILSVLVLARLAGLPERVVVRRHLLPATVPPCAQAFGWLIGGLWLSYALFDAAGGYWDPARDYRRDDRRYQPRRLGRNDRLRRILNLAKINGLLRNWPAIPTPDQAAAYQRLLSIISAAPSATPGAPFGSRYSRPSASATVGTC